MNDPNDTAGGSSGTTWVYEYDRGGNMTAKKRYAYTAGTLGAVQQTVSYTYGDTNWKDKLTTYNGQTFSYDAIGNVTSAEGWTYTWNRGRQLAAIKKGTAGTAGYEEHNFDYDHKGRCIGRTYVYYDTSRSKNVWRGYSYTWAGDRLVHLVTSNRVGDTGNYTTDETMHFHYDAQGKPSMMMYNGTRFGYLYNAQGDVIGIITGGLSEKVKYTYDAWGRLLSITGSSANTIGKANPFRYRAYIYDQECGLYYLRTRYYNPNWCRFVSADTLIGKSSNLLSHNTYSYCRNSVITASDKDGMDAIWILDTNGLSHASLLLQDEQGTWWYYYWGANLDSSSSDSLQGALSFGSSASVSTSSIGNNLKVLWDPLNLKITRYEDADIKAIQAAIEAQYPKDNKCTYTRGIYFEGDFSKSWEAANNRSINQSNMLYSALIENCAQTSLDILGQSIDSFSFMIMHYEMRKLMLPKAIHPLLASFGKEF